MQGSEAVITYEFVNALGERLRELDGDCQVPKEEEGEGSLQRFVVESYPKLLSHLDRYKQQLQDLEPPAAPEDPLPVHDPKSTRRTIKRLQLDRDRLIESNQRLMEDNEKLQRRMKRYAVFEEDAAGSSESNESKLSRLLIMNALKKALVQKELEFEEMVRSKDLEIQQLRENTEEVEEIKSFVADIPQETLLAAEMRVETDVMTEETQIEELIGGSEIGVQTEKLEKGRKRPTRSTQTSSLYLLKEPIEQQNCEVQTHSLSTLDSYSQTDPCPVPEDQSAQVSPTPLFQTTQTDPALAALASTQTPAVPLSIGKSVQTVGNLDLSVKSAGLMNVTPDAKLVSPEGRLSEARADYQSSSDAYKQLYHEKCQECEDLRVLLFRPTSAQALTTSPSLCFSKSAVKLRFEETSPGKPALDAVHISPISPVAIDLSPPSECSGWGGKDTTMDSLAKLRAREREVLDREQKIRRREMMLEGQVREVEEEVRMRRKPYWGGSLTDR